MTLKSIKVFPIHLEDRCDIETIDSRAVYIFIEVSQFIGIHCKSSTKFHFEHCYQNDLAREYGFA